MSAAGIYRSVLLVLLFVAMPGLVEAQEKVPVLLDTDIGTEIDDAFALGLLLNSPEVDLRGVTTCGTDAETRAWMVCRFLSAVDRKTIPVAWGTGAQFGPKVESQFQYRYHPAVLFNRTAKPVTVKEKDRDAVKLMYDQLKADPGKITLLTTGPLTNVAALLTKHPECQPWIKRIVLSGGAIDLFGNIPIEFGARNPPLDSAAFKTVLDAKVPILLVHGASTVGVKLSPAQAAEMFKACTMLTFQVQALYQLWDGNDAALSDAVAVRACLDDKFHKLTPGGLKSFKPGHWQLDNNKGDDHVLLGPVAAPEFLKWVTDRLIAGKPALPKAPPNPSALIPADKMPNRVHAFEDFETDIERKWWMSGKLEKKIAAPAGKRCLRGVLTQDFDDLQGDMKTMYTAVIFNPVPGPPMGKSPHLSFRYRLKGTDTMRVQIYSLTKGYHRCLTLKGLPQGKWQHGTVDMTKVLRPDGSGGPLSENERIDDIQFYVDPRAELLIDDIVLYDAPVAGENRPFPQQIHFTGLFDTGKQGKEWPGKFDIVKNGFFWNAAQAVPGDAPATKNITVNLRGKRPLGDKTFLFLRYHATGAEEMDVELQLDAKAPKDRHIITLMNLKNGQWTEAVLDFSAQARNAKGNPSATRAGDLAEEIRFVVPAGATLMVDDLLLYSTGK